jgi:two-component system, LytTR family, response regulator
MIRALIVDDEPIARAGIAKLLGAERDVVVIGECRDGAEAVARIRADRPDLLFLDVQMPELTGFEVLSSLEPAELPATVFVTAYDQYALDAFEASAVDYLLKPFDRDRFARALTRARRFLAADHLADFRAKIASVLQTVAADKRSLTSGTTLASARNSAGVAGPRSVSEAHARNGDGRLMIRTRGRIAFVGMSEIEWIETSRNYVRVRAKGTWHTVREPLTSFANRLGSQFVRVSRSCIVNLDRVREFRRQANGQYAVILDDGTRLTASRRYGARLAPDSGTRG